MAKREDPSVNKARQDQAFAAKRRRGRSSQILAGESAGQLGDTQVNRPGLRQSALLGQ